MYREIPNILSELKGLTWEILVGILSTRSQNLDIYPTSTLSLKQAMFVYEWYDKNKHNLVIPNEENKNNKQKNHAKKQEKKVPHYIKDAIAVREKVKKRPRLTKNDISFLPANAPTEKLPGAYSTNSQKGLSFNPRLRAAQEKILREKNMKEIGPDAHIIYIPAGGQNKRY